LSIELLNTSTSRLKSYETIGVDISKLKSTIIPSIVAMNSTLLSSGILSLKATFTNPDNKKNIPDKELELFKEFIKKWEQKANGTISWDDYLEFQEAIKSMDGKEKIENFLKIYEKIEHEGNFKENYKKLETATNKIISKLEIQQEFQKSEENHKVKRAIEKLKNTSKFWYYSIKLRWWFFWIGFLTLSLGIGWLLLLIGIVGLMKKSSIRV